MRTAKLEVQEGAVAGWKVTGRRRITFEQRLEVGRRNKEGGVKKRKEKRSLSKTEAWVLSGKT
jgi:hypothetical protein